jgi:multiple sugar transport system ATP-binding protein
MSGIELRNVRKSFGSVDVIKGVDMTIRPGEFMVFVGPSGCGKSTLLRLIAGLEDITSGDLLFDGKVVNKVTPKARGIAMVFQSYALYPHMTVYDNMAFGMQLSGKDKGAIEKRIAEAADMLQITPYLKRLPKQLSGGQRQRVAIGRAIVRDPKVFLFDEPLSNLDAALRVATRLEIARLHEKMHTTTMIYVTHDQVEAMTLADRICVLRDGVVEQIGTPLELYEKPQSLFVAGFIGSPKMNFLNGKFAETFKAHTVGVRAEHIDLKTGDGAWTGKVIHTENLGADSYVFVDLGGEEPVIVRQNGTVRIGNGTPISLAPQAGMVHRFDTAGKPMAA